MKNLKHLGNMRCVTISKIRRKYLKFLSLIFILCLVLVIILYLVWKAENVDAHFEDPELGAKMKKIITVTGQSYAAKFGHVKVYLCKSNPIILPNVKTLRMNNEFWQQVGDDSSKLYIYSAYYDMRVRRVYGPSKHCFVRLLTMLEGKATEVKYYCQIWLTANSTRPVVVDADLQEIWSSDWDRETASSTFTRVYKPYLVSCLLPKKYGTLTVSPTFVSVTLKPCVNSTNLFEIKSPGAPVKKTSKHSFAVCVKPLDFDQDLSTPLVHWLEMNFILGAARVDMYHFRVHPNVNKVLKYYQASGRVNVIPTSLPGNQPNFPVERSQFLKRSLWQKRRNELIPYNDCLYRNMYLYDYIVPLDIDEILVPRLHQNWTQLFEHLHKEDSDKMKYYASYSVRNAYYLELFSGTSSEKPESVYFLRHLYRSANYSDSNRSVKSFVRTDKTLTVFNHYALDAVLPGVGLSTVLPVELIQMNHYRKTCPVTMSKECKDNFLKYKVLDGILMKYKAELEKRTKDILSNLTMN